MRGIAACTASVARSRLWRPPESARRIDAVTSVFGSIPPRFVAAHPIAGTEHSGPDAGFAELFDGRWTILTPLPNDNPAYAEAVAKLSAFWRGCGAQIGRAHV